MVKTIKQLQSEIAVQKARISRETKLSNVIAEKQQLSKQLFQLKNRRLIGVGAKAKRLSKRFGKGLLSVGKKAAPLIKKQARLIRDQQLRDDALEIARLKRQPKVLKSKKRKSIKTPKKAPQDQGIFGNLDF